MNIYSKAVQGKESIHVHFKPRIIEQGSAYELEGSGQTLNEANSIFSAQEEV
jgi:hypothetical protein